VVVGILRLTLSIPGAHSLKDKRRVIHKIVERARARYNASIAEVGDNDVWQRAQLGFCVVSNDRRFVDEVLAKLTRDVEHNADISLLNREVEIETISQMREQLADKPNLDPTAEELAADSGWDLENEERMLAAADAPGEGERPAEDTGVGGGDAAASAEQGDWLTESDFPGEQK
jgi:uncharacterized protein YlxP (DUF503 family)